jgi:prepilin-type N-terminal cleavage/methylation domain-containing protein
MTRRRAFTLSELVVALALFVFVMGAAGELFRSSLQVGAQSQNLSTQTSRIDSAIFQLRHDVWSCGQITVADSHNAEFVQPNGVKIAWTLTADGSVQRTDPTGRVEHWPSIGATWNFAADGPVLVVTDAESKNSQAVRLVSQVLLSREPQS